MFRWLVIFFIFVHSLYAVGSSEILKRAEILVKSSKHGDQFRAYNDYKNVYLQSILLEDTKLKIEALHGIVKSGNNLHVDVSDYNNELLKLNSTKQQEEEVKKYKPKLDSKKKNLIKLNSLSRLTSVNMKDNTIVLVFDQPLDLNQVHYFTIHDKTYKYVFDIQNSVLNTFKRLKKENIKRIVLAQFNSNTIRLVLEKTEKMDITHVIKDGALVITFSFKNSKVQESRLKKVTKEVKTPKRVDRNKIIVIDAGHGGKDPGAIGYKNAKEKVVVLKIAQNLKTILQSRGYTVKMTREKDKFIELMARTEYANKKNADIFISIHANAVEKKDAQKVLGIESYFLSPSRSNRAEKVAAKENSADMSLMNVYGKQSFLNVLNHHKIIASNKLAIDLQRGILGTLNKSYSNVQDGGVREGPFWILVGAQMPAVLVEVGFISHPEEAARLINQKYQKKFALGMADGIERYFINN